MAGTKAGGQEAAKTNKERYGADFYRKIGSKGGKLGRDGGFAAGEEGRERARKWGAIGGQLSRRGPSSGRVAAPDSPEVVAARKNLAAARKHYRQAREQNRKAEQGRG